MAKNARSRTAAACAGPSNGETAAKHGAKDPQTDHPLPDAYTQIREKRDEIVAAVIQRAIKEGCHQRAKWLFEFGAILPQGEQSPDNEPSLVRLLLDQLQIPEDDDQPMDQSNPCSGNDAAVE